MKKLYIILALVVVSFMMVFASDTIKVLRIYRNGTFTAIPLANIDSIDHSKYDANGKLQANYTSSIIETLDSIYNIPIYEIDSVVVTEALFEEYNNNVANIRAYINSKGEMDVSLFQSNLITWLDSQGWVYQTAINKDKDQICVTFSNGIPFIIDFQDLSFFDEIGEDSKARRLSNGNDDDYYNVSFCDGEQIIDQNQILYIEGRAMPGHGGDEYFISEYKQIMNKEDSSPLDIQIKRINYDQNFLNEISSKYGIVIISQTHGSKDGSFQVENENLSGFYGLNGLLVYYYRGIIKTIGSILEIINFQPDLNYRKVSPKEFATKLSFNKKQIIYGNYCYSFGLNNYVNNAIVFGHINESNHGANVQRIIKFMSNMFNGQTYDNSINTTPYSYSKANGGKTIPATNHPESKLRYFSITTDSITDDGNIVGRVNGYENLKKGKLEWVVYVHEGSDEFKPSDEGVEEIKDVVTVNKEGAFEVESDVVYDHPWSSFIVGFKYSNKVYYGGMESIDMCPNENHPHKIDLGLPSGTKWACCNVGASMPFDIGFFYQWGDNEPYSEWSNNEYKYWKDKDHKECIFLGNEISGNPNYDGATYLYGKHWRMPTKAECEELLKNCLAVEYNEWFEVLGRIKGVYVFSYINERWIYLPYYWNTDGGYWTGTAVPEDERTDVWPEISNFAAYSLVTNNPRQTGYVDYDYQPFIGKDRRVFMANIRPVYVDTSDDK